jgi:hypothetical protein
MFIELAAILLTIDKQNFHHQICPLLQNDDNNLLIIHTPSFKPNTFFVAAVVAAVVVAVVAAVANFTVDLHRMQSFILNNQFIALKRLNGLRSIAFQENRMITRRFIITR